MKARARGGESGRMARTSVTIPESMKEQMKRVDVNWKEGVREVIARKLEEEREKDVV
jgi:hypothetical protein